MHHVCSEYFFVEVEIYFLQFWAFFWRICVIFFRFFCLFSEIYIPITFFSIFLYANLLIVIFISFVIGLLSWKGRYHTFAVILILKFLYTMLQYRYLPKQSWYNLRGYQMKLQFTRYGGLHSSVHFTFKQIISPRPSRITISPPIKINVQEQEHINNNHCCGSGSG